MPQFNVSIAKEVHYLVTADAVPWGNAICP